MRSGLVDEGCNKASSFESRVPGANGGAASLRRRNLRTTMAMVTTTTNWPTATEAHIT